VWQPGTPDKVVPGMVVLGDSGGIGNRVFRQACAKKDCEMGLGGV